MPEDALADMKNTNARLRNWSSPAQMIEVGAALVATVLFISTYAVLPSLLVFGHDEVHYYKSFSFKLVEDGRWLNFLLHGFLRSIPVQTWAALAALVGWAVFFRVGRVIGYGTSYAALIASAIMLCPPFVEQSLWPATTFPALIILLFLATWVQGGKRYPTVYLVGGILLFGTLQSVYFLTPLLFLQAFTAPVLSHRKRLLLVLKHMVWWVLGAVAGVLVMSSLLWLKTGVFGVQVAEWRGAQAIHSLADLGRNVSFVWHSGLAHIVQLLTYAGIAHWNFLAVTGVLLFFARPAFPVRRYAYLVLLAVALAFFVFSIPLAPAINTRSLIALAAALVVFVAMAFDIRWLGRAPAALFLLWISYHFALYGHAYLTQHQRQTEFIASKLVLSMPDQPEAYSAIALEGQLPDDADLATQFNSAPLMHGIVHALGAQRYWDCRQGDRCDALTLQRVGSVVPFATGILQSWIDERNKVLLIRFVPAD